MIKLSNLLNATDILNKSLPKLIETFVKFYGEDCREEITEKFSKMMFIGYLNPADLSHMIILEKEDLTKRLLKIAFNRLDFSESEESTIFDVIEKSFSSFDNYDNSQINLLKENLRMYRIGPEKRLEEFIKEFYEELIKYVPDLTYEDVKNKNFKEADLKKIPRYLLYYLDYNKEENQFFNKLNNSISFLKNIYPDITQENFAEYLSSGKLDKIEKLSFILDEAKTEYDEYVKTNCSQIINLAVKYSKMEQEYFQQFADEFKNLLSEEDLKKYEERRAEKLDSISILNGKDIIVGSSFSVESSISFFSEEADGLLNDQEITNYRKDIIRSNRIKYFNYRGINLGNNYEDYLKNPQVIAVWPSQEIVKKIKSRKDYYHNKFNNDYYTSLPFYQETREKIDSLGFLDKEDSFNANAYIRKLTCINPNVVMKNGKYDIFSLILIFVQDSDYLDERIIHELNHLFELFLLNVSNNSYLMIDGWDYFDGKINNQFSHQVDTINNSKPKREYELFNEIINEMIAQEITEIMHSDGVYIFNTKENAKIKGGTSYESTISLVRTFYNTYKKEIIESRRNNNMEVIFKKVGKENFDRLNGLFHIFNEHFSGMAFYQLMYELKESKDTKLTKIYFDIIKTRDEILANMKDYSDSYSSSTNMML